MKPTDIPNIIKALSWLIAFLNQDKQTKYGLSKFDKLWNYVTDRVTFDQFKLSTDGIELNNKQVTLQEFEAYLVGKL